MIFQGIRSVVEHPMVAQTLNCVEHATNSGLEYSIDGLVVGIALGVLAGYVVVKCSRNPPDVGIDKNSIDAVIAFGATVFVSTTAGAIYGVSKSVFGF